MNDSERLPVSPAAERNKQPIAEVLGDWLPAGARVLEIGSGTGQHAVYFNGRLEGVQWQASEIPQHLPLLAERVASEAPGLLEPLSLDVTGAWPDGPFDAVFTANTLHIMPWQNTPLLLERAAERLVPGGRLIVYGPFHDGGRHNAESNERFDRTLRERNPAMGIRDALEIDRLAGDCGLTRAAEIDMPANNRILIWQRANP